MKEKRQRRILDQQQTKTNIPSGGRSVRRGAERGEFGRSNIYGHTVKVLGVQQPREISAYEAP